LKTFAFTLSATPTTSFLLSQEGFALFFFYFLFSSLLFVEAVMNAMNNNLFSHLSISSTTQQTVDSRIGSSRLIFVRN
jgi:hypothetical protein